jgi:hypothetical protein
MTPVAGTVREFTSSIGKRYSSLLPLLRRWRSGSEPGELTSARWIPPLADQGVIQAYFEGGEPLNGPGRDDQSNTWSTLVFPPMCW